MCNEHNLFFPGHCDSPFDLAALQKALKPTMFEKWLKAIQASEMEKVWFWLLNSSHFCLFWHVVEFACVHCQCWKSKEEKVVLVIRPLECPQKGWTRGAWELPLLPLLDNHGHISGRGQGFCLPESGLRERQLPDVQRTLSYSAGRLFTMLFQVS